MRKFVFALAAVGALAGVAFGSTAAAAVTYSYTGTATVWDLSFTYTTATPIDHDSDVTVPCTDNHGDTSCTLVFDLAGSPAYVDPITRGGFGADSPDDTLTIDSTGGPGGDTAEGCCIGYGLDLPAGALTHDGVYVSPYDHGTLTVSGNPAASPTPEPAAWALMILGFGGVGAALRRRQPALVR